MNVALWCCITVDWMGFGCQNWLTLPFGLCLQDKDYQRKMKTQQISHFPLWSSHFPLAQCSLVGWQHFHKYQLCSHKPGHCD